MIALFLLLQTTPVRPTLPTPPACGAPFQDAAIVQRVNPEIPHGSTIYQPVQGSVQVSVAPDGSVAAVQMVQSTGDSQLDAAILDAARRSTYQAKSDNCTPTFGTYLYHASFGGPSPLPSGAPADACNHEGRVTSNARAVYPLSMQLKSAQTAIVRVTVGADGMLTKASIVQSTGNDVLDQSAIDAAKHSVYAPKVEACKAVVADYLIKIVFNPH